MDKDAERRDHEARVIGAPQPAAPPELPADPLWRRAPFLFHRFPMAAVAVFVAMLILSLAAASSPLFVASASAAALDRSLRGVRPEQAGLTVVAFGLPSGSGITSRDQQLSLRVGRIAEMGRRILTLVGSEADIGLPDTGPVAGLRGRLAFRSGFEGHIEPVAQGPEEGVWIADSTAEAAGLAPGARIILRLRGLVTDARVGGIYRSPASGSAPGAAPLPEYWQPLAGFLRSPPERPPPPPLILVPRPEFAQIGLRLRDEARLQWEFPLRARGMALARAEEVASELEAVQAELDDRSTSLGSSLPLATETTEFPRLVQEAGRATNGLRGPVETVSLAGRLIALAAVAGVGLFVMHRRRTEVRLLWARGVGPTSLGARTALEGLVPTAIGALSGWGLAVGLVRLVGPSPLTDGLAARSAASSSAAASILGIAILGVAAAAWAHTGLEREASRVRRALVRIPWGLVALALAAAAYSGILVRRSTVIVDSDGVPRVDTLVILLPFLLIAGGAGTVVRAGRRALPRLRLVGAGWPPSVLLASRRLAGASGPTLILVVAAALALGMFLFSGWLVASTRATMAAKARIFTGSDVAATLPRSAGVVEVPFPSTAVTRVPEALGVPGDLPVDVLGIDLASFPQAAFFDPSFGASSLRQLVDRLSSTRGEGLAAVMAGTTPPTDPFLIVAGNRIDLEVAGAVSTLPGMAPDRGLLVVEREALDAALQDAGTSLAGVGHEDQVWVRGQPSIVAASLRATGVRFERMLTAEQVEATPSFLVASWTLASLQALGTLTGFLALAAVLLYRQARQRSRVAASALTRRMGLSRAGLRGSVALELAAMLLAALVLGGALALLAARLVVGRVELLEGIPLDSLLRFPLPLVLGATAAVALVAWVGAMLVQRSADRANVSEALRVAG